MNLSKKTFWYSILLAAIMTAFIVGYFIFMLPSLYVDYVKESNYQSVVDVQRGYMKERGYDNLSVKNPMQTVTFEIPDQGNEIYLSGQFFRLSAEIRDKELLQLLDGMRRVADYMTGLKENEGNKNTDDESIHKEIEEIWNQSGLSELSAEQLQEKFFAAGGTEEEPFVIRMEKGGDNDTSVDEYVRLHAVASDLFVCETGITYGDTSYISYFAFGKTEDAVIVTIQPTVTPKMSEIMPVVLRSLPMITAVVFFLAMLLSYYFSGKVVNPLLSLYYRELEDKNRILEEENERQEVFLRASSHQLKTPITAALLLTDGMIGEVGKYKETKKYLPEVKKQLLSMRKIVEDILYLNHYAKNMLKEPIDLRVLTEEVLSGYEVQIEDKELKVIQNGEGSIEGDREILRKVLDNLVSNAILYTPPKEKIILNIGQDMVCVRNEGVRIDEKLLPNIYKPFVSSDTRKKGKGLGLYVTAYYCKLAGWNIHIENEEKGVCAALTFAPERKGEI